MTQSKMSNPQRTRRLGLIGGNITESRSPALQISCGISVGLNVSYDLLIPAERNTSFADLLRHCEAAGFDGVNVTYPSKEEAANRVPAGDPVVSAMGACNTVKFGPEGPRAYNTDYSGFMAAYRLRYGDLAPGAVLVLGTGGVGRAVAFGLAELGATSLALFDTDMQKCESLRAALLTRYDIPVTIVSQADLSDLTPFEGVVNCTPLGMIGRPGSPLPTDLTGSIRWGFDAVYTPEETPFRDQVLAQGGDFLGGYELYFHQGIDGFAIFTGIPVTDTDWVRQTITHKP